MFQRTNGFSKIIFTSNFIYLLFNCGIILHTITGLLKVDFSVATGCAAITVVCRLCRHHHGLQVGQTSPWSAGCAGITMACRVGRRHRGRQGGQPLLVSPARAFLSFLRELPFSFFPPFLSSAWEITRLLSFVTSVCDMWGIFVVPLQKRPINWCYVTDLVIQ